MTSVDSWIHPPHNYKKAFMEDDGRSGKSELTPNFRSKAIPSSVDSVNKRNNST